MVSWLNFGGNQRWSWLVFLKNPVLVSDSVLRAASKCNFTFSHRYLQFMEPSDVHWLPWWIPSPDKGGGGGVEMKRFTNAKVMAVPASSFLMISLGLFEGAQWRAQGGRWDPASIVPELWNRKEKRWGSSTAWLGEEEELMERIWLKFALSVCNWV